MATGTESVNNCFSSLFQFDFFLFGTVFVLNCLLLSLDNVVQTVNLIFTSSLITFEDPYSRQRTAVASPGTIELSVHQHHYYRSGCVCVQGDKR